MKISFPQNLFENPPIDNIKRGKKICKDSKILFCGIARDVEKTIELNIQRLLYIKRYFKDSNIFIYENNSNDQTLNIIKQSNICYESENRIDYKYKNLIQSGNDNNHFNRCKVLANCRNKYINFARNNHSSYDFICILDWDIHGWSYKGFFDSIYRLHENNNLASVSAYGLLSDYHNKTTLERYYNNLIMYDSFAFRPFQYYGPLYPNVQSNFNYYKCTAPTIVRSNFGGMALYKMNVVLQSTYGANEIYGTVDCDHVVLNDNISTLGFEHLLNNYFIVSYSRHRFDNDRS